MKKLLTIAGSDCSGGAGIQADMKTFSANETYAMSVITSVVAENTCGVISIHNVPVEIVKDQIDAIFSDIEVDGVKVGMLSDANLMKAVAEKLRQYTPKIVVVDPVMIAKGGCALMQEDALETLKKEIIPCSYLLTPNIPEAETLIEKKISTMEDMKLACKEIHKMGAQNVLVKGGHFEGDPIDVLFDGKQFFTFEGKRIDSKNTHGTGCTLSSAITAQLAHGKTVEQAVAMGKDYVTNAIKNTVPIGHGHGPTHHFYKWFTA